MLLLIGASFPEMALQFAKRAAQVAAIGVPITPSKTHAMYVRRSLSPSAPHQLAACPISGGVVRAVEVYAPRYCANTSPPEEHHDCSGLRACGLVVGQQTTCGEDEDAVSMALTVLQRLMRRCSVSPTAVGMVHVGATLLDRSKSMTTELMTLIEGVAANAEGVDAVQQCKPYYCEDSHRRQSALMSCLSWTQSGSWDGEHPCPRPCPCPCPCECCLSEPACEHPSARTACLSLRVNLLVSVSQGAGL